MGAAHSVEEEMSNCLESRGNWGKKIKSDHFENIKIMAVQVGRGQERSHEQVQK